MLYFLYGGLRAVFTCLYRKRTDWVDGMSVLAKLKTGIRILDRRSGAARLAFRAEPEAVSLVAALEMADPKSRERQLLEAVVASGWGLRIEEPKQTPLL